MKEKTLGIRFIEGYLYWVFLIVGIFYFVKGINDNNSLSFLIGIIMLFIRELIK